MEKKENELIELRNFKNNSLINSIIEEKLFLILEKGNEKDLQTLVEINAINEVMVDNIINKLVKLWAGVGCYFNLLLKYNLLNFNKKYGYLKQTVLFYCAPYDTELFIKAGCDVNSKNIFGETKLLISWSNFLITEPLLNHGADVFVKDRKGLSLIHLIDARLLKYSNHDNCWTREFIKLKQRVESIVEKTLTILFLKHTNLFKELIDIIIKFYKL